MRKTAFIIALCGMLSLASCTQNETPPSSAEETAVTTEAATETPTEAETEPTTKAITEPEYFGQLVYPDTMTDKEKNGTYYRGDTILDADKAYEIGEYHLPLETTARAKVKKMMDNIRELKMYDEQTDTNYMVNIVLPPDYDENREYPVFLVTDSQYWFSHLPNVWKLISKGQAAPVIFVTLRIDYELNSYDDKERYDRFVLQQEELLDFITNDLMQLVSLNYRTDSSQSVFFGHSLGGLFAHYALCNSDKYEYQPFAKYIIASPAMWSYYYTGEENFDTSGIPDPYAYREDFGYFDRNESMDKDVFICAGAEEHYNFDAPDLATIPEDAQTIYERFTSHGVNAEIKLYEGMMHMSYVEDMLKEYLSQNFPPEDSTDEQSEGLVYPDTMTDKEKNGTYYRGDTILDADKAYEIGEYHLPLDPTARSRVKKMMSNNREMRVYDEQLDLNFMANIVLPPDYDENKEYPVILITDSQYWIDEVADLWKLIGDGESSPVIFATLRLDYDINGYTDARYDEFVLNQDKTLDFITNDFMQLVSLNYRTDSSQSVFFGHSLGGLFAHYALCNSDKYEYQPFAKYIIASPAMWSYYYDDSENVKDDYDIEKVSDPYAYRNDFGYFDRNKAMDKDVFICAGADEHYDFDDPDLPTIPEDAQTVYDRLQAHGVNAEIKLYEGMMHMSYVEDMLKDYIKKTFPMGNNLQEEHK